MTTGRINQIAPMGSTAKHHQERPKAPRGGLQELFPHVKTSAKLATLLTPLIINNTSP
jgi:hypothetical protein